MLSFPSHKHVRLYYAKDIQMALKSMLRNEKNVTKKQPQRKYHINPFAQVWITQGFALTFLK